MMRQGTKELAPSAQTSLGVLEGWRKKRVSLSPALAKIFRRAAFLFLFGALSGPLIGFSIQYIARGNIIDISSGESPARVMLFFAAFGVLMSFTCFITCGLPTRYINRALRHFPKFIHIPLRALAGFGGTLLGLAVSSQVIWWIFHVHLIKEEDMRAALMLSAIAELRADARHHRFRANALGDTPRRGDDIRKQAQGAETRRAHGHGPGPRAASADQPALFL